MEQNKDSRNGPTLKPSNDFFFFQWCQDNPVGEMSLFNKWPGEIGYPCRKVSLPTSQLYRKINSTWITNRCKDENC